MDSVGATYCNCLRSQKEGTTGDDAVTKASTSWRWVRQQQEQYRPSTTSSSPSSRAGIIVEWLHHRGGVYIKEGQLTNGITMFKLVLSISPYPPQTHAVQFVTHPSQPNAEPRH